ncbi:trypsin-2-like [Lampetra fluviatilis]
MKGILVLACIAAVMGRLAAATLPSTLIVGGSEVAPHAIPSQASLRYNGVHICGAALIRTNWVITSAHCYKAAQNLKVVLGDHSMSKAEGTERTFSVSRVVRHEKFNNVTNDNDVMLVKLSTNVALNANVQLVALQTSALPPGTLCNVSGWGTLQETSNKGSDVLRAVTVPIVSNALCNSTLYYRGLITVNMLCAGFDQGGKDACRGDSGGPLICSKKLKGLVSWGLGCARPRYFGIYTDVSRFISWINNILATY